MSSSVAAIPAVALAWSALVLVPLGLAVIARSEPTRQSWPFAWARRLALPAAVPLACATQCDPGWLAAGLAAPWLAVCSLAALGGATRTIQRGLAPVEELAIDAGLMNLAVGAAWALAWCAGWQVLGFAPLWALLTAVHFHVAGFALPIFAGSVARASVSGDGLSAAATVGVVGIIAGIPLTALGIAFSRHLELVAAIVLTAAAVTVAVMSLRVARSGAAAALSIASGLALLLAMPLAANYALGAFGPIRVGGLDLGVIGVEFRIGSLSEIETMALTHGVLDAVAFAGAGLLAAWLAPAPPRHRFGVPFSRLASRGRVDADLFARNGWEHDQVPAHGLVDELGDLSHPGFDPSRVAPAIRAFYERTDAHALRVVPQWRTGFRLGARLWTRLARRLGQLQLPVRAERGGDGIATRIVSLDDGADGRPGARAWIRTYADGRAMYVAAYAVHARDRVAYMNIAFPLPRGNLASVLRMDALPGGADGDAIVLTTHNPRRGIGDAGIWLVAVRRGRPWPIALPMNETIRVWTPTMPTAPADLVARASARTTCIARHDLWLLGVRYATLDYVIDRTM